MSRFLQDFQDYNQFLDLADDLIQELELEGIYQIASFHPRYQFQGTKVEDSENYTNRSPYPVLHLLREQSLEKVIDSYPDIASIPTRNIELMKKLGTDELRETLKSCYLSDIDH